METQYTSSGTYTANLTNINGCDSLATLNLTNLNPTSGSETASACQNYTWNGNTYSTSGTYTANFTNAAGCDSVATLNLTITGLPNVSAPNASEICDTLDAFPLIGGFPIGGTYSGTSVLNNSFDPSIGAGNHTITYSYTDANGCSASDNGTFQVIFMSKYSFLA
jgi:trimeric autotransporter adhesin